MGECPHGVAVAVNFDARQFLVEIKPDIVFQNTFVYAEIQQNKKHWKAGSY